MVITNDSTYRLKQGNLKHELRSRTPRSKVGQGISYTVVCTRWIDWRTEVLNTVSKWRIVGVPELNKTNK